MLSKKNKQLNRNPAALIFAMIISVATILTISSFALTKHKTRIAKNNDDNATQTAQPIYSQLQQIFCLSILSNISGLYTGRHIKDSTFKAVDRVLKDKNTQQYIGHWKRIWGPVVFTKKDAAFLKMRAANTLFIAQNADDTSLYVLSIAGTDEWSVYDWAEEDLDVTKIKFWHDVIQGGDARTLSLVHKHARVYSDTPFISRATYNGLAHIMNLKDHKLKGRPTVYTFLTDLINKHPNQKLTFWVTGHSLGAAISASLGLYLKDTKCIWAKNNNAGIKINCLLIAGSTPGNKRFADYYNSELGANTIRVWNRRDFVPHGFSTDQTTPPFLQQVDTLFKGANIKTNGIIKAAIKSSVKKLDKYHYNYTPLLSANTGFSCGYFTDKNLIDPKYKKNVNPNTFLGQAACQHISSYMHYFGVDTFEYCVQRTSNYEQPFYSAGFTRLHIDDSGAYGEMLEKFERIK